MTRLTHLDDKGAARMVDVSDKNVTARSATAQALVEMKSETLDLILAGAAKKGDVFAAARIAGIMAAKKTSDLIPLCHPLAISKAEIEFMPQGNSALMIAATVKVEGKTGVEMEALTAASVAALTVYDMCKAIDRGMRITEICLVEKTGGKSGRYARPKS